VFTNCSSLREITLPFVGGTKKTTSDTYQYPFGYIFGSSSATGCYAAAQTYIGSSTSTTITSTYYIPNSLRTVRITGGELLQRGAFMNCNSLERIELPVISVLGADSLKCTNLKELVLRGYGSASTATMVPEATLLTAANGT
jgi:hypothetical protein